MPDNTRLPIVLSVMFLISGCQTASLEDAAPLGAVPAPSVTDPAIAEPATVPASPQPKPAAADIAAAAVPAVAAPVTVRRNPGFASVIPIEKTRPVENTEFVAQGARRNGQFPTFGIEPQAANSQLTAAERLAAEAEMAELLRARAATPSEKQLYEDRLKRLRELARTHAEDAARQIEN